MLNLEKSVSRSYRVATVYSQTITDMKSKLFLLFNKTVEVLSYYILRTAFLSICIVFKVVLAVKYWRKKKHIPAISNPLLFKSATLLAKEIREGNIKSEDVIQAYIERIVQVEPYINATVECCFQNAMQEARAVDALVESGKYTKEQLEEDKPLLGVPLTVKLLFFVKGCLCTCGSTFFKDKRASEDSCAVALMRKAGCIFIATTNISEFGMHFETTNFVHGRTSNPYDIRKTCGGSSGGEGALISAAGSLIGLGNDASGSIRIPSAFTGIFGHKPTAGIVPNDGSSPGAGYMGDYLCSGPMCRYAEDLIITMKALTLQHETSLPFGRLVDFQQLKVLFFEDIGHPLIYPVDKEIAKGIQNAASYFQKKYGAEVKKLHMPTLQQVGVCSVYNLFARSNNVQNLKAVVTDGKGTSINETLDLVKYLFGKSTFSEGPLVILNSRKCPLFVRKRNIPYYQNLLDDIAHELKRLLDDNTVFLFPTFPTTAPYHNGIFPLITSSSYTNISNCLGLPSTHCPLGFHKDGMPYGVQIITGQNNDPLTIACAVELEKAFGGWIPPKSE